jgi:hypothetical protein
MEDVSNAAACTFGDFACALGSADTSILGTDADAFADVTGGVDGVECDEVDGSFAGAFGDIADGSACTFADVSGSAADVATGAAALIGGGLGLGCLGLGLRSGGRCGLLLAVGGCAGEDECEEDAVG